MWYRFNDFGDSNSYTWTATSPGNRKFYVEVKDYMGNVSRSEAIDVRVGLSVSGSVNVSNCYTGDKVVINATTQYQSGDCTYSYLMHNKTTDKWYRFQDFDSNSSLVWTAVEAGDIEFFVEAKDNNGKTVRSAAINVNVSFKALSISTKNSATVCTVGDSIEIEASASGGYGNYEYSFLVNNVTTGEWYRFNGFSSENNFSWIPTTDGERKFYVEVKDAFGNVVRSQAIDLNVGLSVDAIVNKSVCTTGETIKIEATSSCISSECTYSYLVHNIDTDVWYRFQGFEENDTFIWKASSVGNREFFVEVKDSNGKVVRSKPITVNVVE